MRQQFRVLGAVAIAGLVAGGLSACTAKNTFEDDASLSEKITSVRLDSSASNITVQGKDGAGAVSVHRKVEYDHDRPGVTAKVENGVLVLNGCGRDCSVNYTVAVPAGLPVSGKVTAGTITLSRVGAVQVTTTDGSIDLDGVAGAVEAHTSNGTINGRALNGDRITAETDNGTINLAPATAQSVRAKTSSGAITVTAPAGQYRVTAQTSNGDTNIGVTNDPAGQYQLDLRSSNGTITVKSA